MKLSKWRNQTETEDNILWFCSSRGSDATVIATHNNRAEPQAQDTREERSIGS